MLGYRSREASSQQPILSRLFFIFCRFFFKFYCPLRITGQGNLPTPPFILCSNHCSHMDTPVLMISTKLTFDLFGILAAKDYFFDQKKRRNIVQLLMNIIPINRTSTRRSMMEDIAQCRDFIQKSKGCLIMYPEGTRSLDGEIQSFKRGIAFIARELGLPIVPVYIQGTHVAMGKQTIFPKPGKINLVIGVPLFLEKTTERQSNRWMTRLLEHNIRELKAIHYER